MSACNTGLQHKIVYYYRFQTSDQVKQQGLFTTCMIRLQGLTWLITDPPVFEKFSKFFDKRSQNDSEGIGLALSKARFQQGQVPLFWQCLEFLILELCPIDVQSWHDTTAFTLWLNLTSRIPGLKLAGTYIMILSKFSRVYHTIRSFFKNQYQTSKIKNKTCSGRHVNHYVLDWAKKTTPSNFMTYMHTMIICDLWRFYLLLMTSGTPICNIDENELRRSILGLRRKIEQGRV